MNANSVTPDTPAPAEHPDTAAIAALARTPRWWSWIVGELQEDPAHALTLAYLAISVLGVWGSYWFFRSFGVAILDYMSPSDYLTAGLRDPSHLIVVVLAYLMSRWVSYPHRVWLANPAGYAEWRLQTRMRRWWMPKDPDRGGRWIRRYFGWRGFTSIGAVLYGVLTLSMCLSMVVAVQKAKEVRRGGGHPVRVTLTGAGTPLPGTARMLGTVGDFVFLYWPGEKRAEAVALAHAARIESLVPGRVKTAASVKTTQSNASPAR